jgi:hypothetical protein
MIERKFEIGDGYKTRDGRDAGIYWIGDEVMHGWVEHERHERYERKEQSWLLSGRRHVELKSSSDIMPKPEPLIEFWDVYEGDCYVGRTNDPNNVKNRERRRIVHMREVRDE